jgi:two-component system, OmpR family, KDP operon response regulator KdpE
LDTGHLTESSDRSTFEDVVRGDVDDDGLIERAKDLVLVIEDDPDVTELLRHALGMAGMSTAMARNAVDGVRAATRLRPDAVLLDLDLPDADGLDVLPELRTIAPVIVLTGRKTEEAIVRGLRQGADDYVTKPFSPRVLVARIEVAVRRGRSEVRERIVAGPLAIDVGTRLATLDGVALDLTRRELDLLAHLAQRPGVVVSRDDLLRAVWQSSAEWQTASTVTEHVRRVRMKLGDPRWIESARGVGYRFTIPES